MARHPKGTNTVGTSRHVRDLTVLRQAQLAAIRPRTPPVAGTAAPGLPISTINWQAGAEEPLLAPRLLQDQELPTLQLPAVRRLIDVTARGHPTPPQLRSELLGVDLDTLQAAIIEGIHRWHTYRSPAG